MRLAICGLGAAARNIHIPAYKRLADVEVVGGCDPDPEARNRFRDAVPALFEDLPRMLDELHPDAVAICTPPSLHHEQVMTALDRGCHVFAEKPLCETLDQADEIIQRSRVAERRVVVNTQFPRMRIYRAAKNQIGTDGFGRLLFIHAWQTFDVNAKTEAGWRGELKRRVSFEFGVHVFDLIRYFFDAEPARLFAHMPQPLGLSHFDAINTIALEFDDGRAASIVLDRLSRGPERYLELRLDGEFASVHTSIGGSLELRAGIAPRGRRPFVRLDIAGGGKALLQKGEKSRLLAREGLNPFSEATAIQFQEFMEEIATGSPSRSTVTEHRKTLALVLAVYQSAAQSTMIDLPRSHG